jgi:hypothetical protein
VGFNGAVTAYVVFGITDSPPLYGTKCQNSYTTIAGTTLSSCYDACSVDSNCGAYQVYDTHNSDTCYLFNDCSSFTTSGETAQVGYTVTQTPSPTVNPTTSPTGSPTPSPGVVLGEAKVKMSYTNSTKTKESSRQLIDDLKQEYSSNTDYDINIKSVVLVDQFTLNNDVLSGVQSEALITKLKTARNCSNCAVTFGTGNRRVLQQSMTVTMTFTLDEAGFDLYEQNTESLESQAFLTSLATELGVNSENITLTVVDSNVVIETELITYSDGENPLDSSTLNQLTTLKSSMETTAGTITSTLGGGSVSTYSVDLCGTRNCNNRGTCNVETGVCACTDADYWGINCELAVSCNDGTKLANYAYCQCEYPAYGLRCESNIIDVFYP